MKHLWILLFCIITSANADVYRWHDEQGRVVYSDEYVPGSELVDLPSLPTYTPTPILEPVVSVEEDDTTEEDLVPDYQLSITSPENDQTVRANDGNLDVTIKLVPELDNEKRGDQLIVLVDGQQQGSAISETNFKLTNIDRGTHTLTVSVVDSEGKILKISKAVTFHLQRHAGGRPRPTPL
jgi:uncharacterized protein DUF4124